MEETAKVLLSILGILSQTGFAVAAYRVVVKLNGRFEAHEAKDEKFHGEVRTKLGIPAEATNS